MANQVTDRAALGSLIPEQTAEEIISEMPYMSAALAAFRSKPIRSKRERVRMLDVFPEADWVEELTGANKATTDHVKPVTSTGYADAWLNVEPVAAIVVIPDEVTEDIRDGAGIDIWSEIRPQLAASLAVKIDQAVLFGVPGTSSPATFPDGIEVGARAVGNVVSQAGYPDLVAAINGAWAEVEEDDFDVSVQFAHRRIRSQLRDLRDDNGMPIFSQTLREGVPGNDYTVFGEPLQIVGGAGWTEAAAIGGPGAKMIVGDASRCVIGVRTDIEYKILDQATVVIGGTAVNLAQSDSTALRVRMRIGFRVDVPASRDASLVDRYPFAVLEP